MKTVAILPALFVAVLVILQHFDISSGIPQVDHWVAIFIDSFRGLRGLLS